MAKLLVRGPAPFKVGSPTALRPGDLLDALDDAHAFSQAELGSNLFVCLHVSGVSARELTPYCASIGADERGGALALKRAWSIDLGRLGLRGTDGLFHRTWDQLRHALVRKEAPVDPLHFTGRS